MNRTVLEQLLEKGVKIPNPESVFIADDVDADRISGNGVVLYGGTKLLGNRTLIMDHAVIGYEAPVVLEDTLVGPDSRLNGGFFQGAVFMGQNVFGSGGHVRRGTILEEQANAAHTVGLKQTILFPFVTLGSLINFCDCLMAGGTSRKDHSEVGSSFIHFNYTPNQDKATPSMFGNVHQGVMLNQPPIFLGGQGGVVGPLRLGFGCITAAGSIVRKSEEALNRLILGGGMKSISLPRKPGVYTQVKTIFNHNVVYIAELIALRAWYCQVRPMFAQGALSGRLIQGLQENLENCIQERIKRFVALIGKFEASKQAVGLADAAQIHDQAIQSLKKAEAVFNGFMQAVPDSRDAEEFLEDVHAGIRKNGRDYVNVIQGLSEESAGKGSRWLGQLSSTIVQSLEI